jgi:hypothetical protein
VPSVVGVSFCAFCEFSALAEFVTYPKMEGWKVQVPSPAFPLHQIAHHKISVQARQGFPLLNGHFTVP